MPCRRMLVPRPQPSVPARATDFQGSSSHFTRFVLFNHRRILRGHTSDEHDLDAWFVRFAYHNSAPDGFLGLENLVTKYRRHHSGFWHPEQREGGPDSLPNLVSVNPRCNASSTTFKIPERLTRPIRPCVKMAQFAFRSAAYLIRQT